MSSLKFSEEQQEELRSNKYTAKVTANSLFLKKEFKALFYEKYQAGMLPRDILQECGYPVEIFGRGRIWNIAYCIKKEYKTNGCFRDILTPKTESSMPGSLTQDQKIQQLQQKVDYLTQEIEFLKKISSVRITRK